MTLSDDQLRTFQARGYVNAGPVFDPRQLETIAKEYDRLRSKPRF